MTTLAEHQLSVRQLLAPLGERAAVRVELPLPIPARADARPLVLASPVVSAIDLPPFDNSQMDGYAVAAADVRPGRPLTLAPRIPAGVAPARLAPGTAAPIMTGAPMPIGADAVVPIEETLPNRFLPDSAAGTEQVSFPGGTAAGTFVRRRGSDLLAGSTLLEAGIRLGPPQLGLLAAAGVTSVDVRAPVRVLVISTGDELSAPGESLAPGRIHDANGVSVTAALAAAGATVIAAAVVRDDTGRLRGVVAEHAADADLIVTTGGVSEGAYEVVRAAFEHDGVAFTKVALQPAGPQGLGSVEVGDRMIPLVAFPGNPVSALVSFELFLRPVIRELLGLPPDRPRRMARLASALDSPVGKHQVRRGRLLDDDLVDVVGGASSHLIAHYAASTHLIHVSLGVAHLDAGDPVEIWRIDD